VGEGSCAKAADGCINRAAVTITSKLRHVLIFVSFY